MKVINQLICLLKKFKPLDQFNTANILKIFTYKNQFRVKKTSETFAEVGDSIGKAFSGFGIATTSKLAEMKYV